MVVAATLAMTMRLRFMIIAIVIIFGIKVAVVRSRNSSNTNFSGWKVNVPKLCSAIQYCQLEQFDELTRFGKTVNIHELSNTCLGRRGTPAGKEIGAIDLNTIRPSVHKYVFVTDACSSIAHFC